MAAARYAYTGGAEMWYQDYLDNDTGKMLAAIPGESYSMAPVNPALPVPPGDGRWQETGPALPAPVSLPVPAPVLASASDGGES